MKTITFTYSSPCKEALENLIKEITSFFGSPLTIDDMFWYGVFCTPETYAAYNWDYSEFPSENVPEPLIAYPQTTESKMNCVNDTINKVITGEIKRPEWMIAVEEDFSCANDEAAPSTFLYLKPKSEEYENLAKRLIEFLYSPNKLSEVVIPDGNE